MSKLTSELNKHLTADEVNDATAISEYMIEFHNYIVFNSDVQDRFKETHKGFQETLKNGVIWGNYVNLAIVGEPKLLIPTDIKTIDKVSDYFTEEHSERFIGFVMTLHKLLNLPAYRKILSLGMLNGSKPNQEK